MNTLFLHMPKCAGSSMREILQRKFAVTYDYDSFFRFPKEERMKLILDALRSPEELPNNTFIFGHFFPVKYLGQIKNNKENFRLITFLRDPIQRLASHYSFWQNSNFSDHYLWRKMKSENWSFKEFCLSQEMKNFYSQYLIYIPLSTFDFVGIHENLNKDWEQLCQIFEIEYEKLPHINKSPNLLIKELSDEDKNQIENYHSEDISLYLKFKKLKNNFKVM